MIHREKAPFFSHKFHRIFRFILVLLIGITFTQVLPWFATSQTPQVAAATDPVIGAAGDIACDPASSSFNAGNGTASACRQKYTAALLINTGLTAVLPLGDTQYYCGGLTAFEKSYALSWGKVLSISHPAAGNHEYLTSGGTNCSTNAAGYFKYYGSLAGPVGKGYYSYNIGAWHLIALNTQCSNVGGCSSGSAQYNWLKSDLAANAGKCTLAYWHIPLFSSGGRANSNSRPFWQLLYNAKADVVLTGHDHTYERFALQNASGVADPNGLREFVVGTGGGNHTSFVSTAANSQVRNNTTFGILRLTLHSKSYDWKFVPEAGKTFTDSGTTACHTGTAATATPTKTLTPTGTRPTNTPTGTHTPTLGPAVSTLTPTTSGTAASFTFRPAADAYVDSSQPTANFGTGTTLRVDGSPIVNSYIRFNVSGLSGTISRVRLLIFANTTSSLGIKANKVADTTWGETTITYNAAPPIGSVLATSAAFNSGTWVTLDVSGSVTGNGSYSFAITNPSATAISLAARESGANAEQLIVDTK